jgi:carboxypeptidase family protein/TonB-dependent receptor-like protein
VNVKIHLYTAVFLNILLLTSVCISTSIAALWRTRPQPRRVRVDDRASEGVTMANRSERSRRQRPCRLAVACLVALHLASAAAFAQGTSASIIGQVVDESGAVLPGVTVTATSPALQVAQVTFVTDGQGEYRLTPLPIGTYIVIYELSGFQTVRRENVPLTAGFVAKLDIKMKVGAVAETVTVSGAAPVVDVTTTATVTHLTKTTLESTPNGHFGIVSILAMAPGVRGALDSGGSKMEETSGGTGLPSYAAFGQTNEGWMTLEGVSVNPPKRGPSGLHLDYTGIEETRVSTVGNGADMPSPGIQMASIIKSGGNDFHGSGLWTQTGHQLQNSNLLPGQTGGQILNRLYMSGELGGRLVKDQLWFFGSANWSVHHFTLLNLVKEDGTPDDPFENQSFTNLKLSYQMSRGNRLIFFHQHDHENRINTPSLNAFNPWAFRSYQPWSNDTVKAEWQSVVGDSLTTSVQYGYFDWDSLQYSPPPDTPAVTDLFTQQNSGTNWVRHLEHALEYNYHLRGSMDWYKPGLVAGNHQFTLGFDYLLPTINRSRGARGAALDYQLVFNNGAPFELNTDNFPVDPFTKSHYLGIYGQDRWAINRQLTVTLGARFAHDNGFVPEQCREAGAFIDARCLPKVQFQIWNTVAPRAQAAWDVTGKGKVVIKGGWARFDHQRMLDPELLAANQNAPEVRTWLWHDNNGNRKYDAGEVNLDPNGPDFVTVTGIGVSSNPSYAIPNANEKEPKQDQFSLAYEHEIVPNIGVRVTGLYARYYNLYRLTNTKRPDSVYNIPVSRPDPGPDGRVGTADDPGTILTYYEYPTSYVGLQFLQGMLVNDPRNVAKFNSVEVAVAKRLSNGWHAMASYSATKKRIPFGSVDPVPTDPNSEINTADNTWTRIGKVNASYLFPGRVTVSTNLESRSGDPWQRTVLVTGGRTIPSLVMNVEAVGTRQLPTINLLDFRADKQFQLKAGHRVGVRMNVFNSLNAATPTIVINRSGANFGQVTSILPGRVVEFGASYSF